MNLLIRRRQEAFQEKAQRAVDDLRVATNIVAFEHRSGKGIQRTLVRQRIAEANARVRAEVDARRARLASLLEAEKQHYEAEIAASFETPAQVKERMLSLARKLKEEREAERRALAEELELRRFKASSDALREHESKRLTEKTGLDRVAQLQVRQGVPFCFAFACAPLHPRTRPAYFASAPRPATPPYYKHTHTHTSAGKGPHSPHGARSCGRGGCGRGPRRCGGRGPLPRRG